MDAGVPIKAQVAGIAMGLVKEDRYAVITDILGDEDHLGDMDFKVAGTAKGVTALQMDIKIEGINEEIMETALAQAYEARCHILNEMNQIIAEPRAAVSDNAPSIATIEVNPDKIRDVIGKGGVTIRAIQEETGAQIDIDDSGLIRVYGENAESRARPSPGSKPSRRKPRWVRSTRDGVQDRRLRRLREHHPRQGRPGAYLADCPGAG